MLQDSISKIKYLLLLALLAVLPMQAFGGADFDTTELIDQTDFAAFRLVYFYDGIDRSTFIQVTNTASSGVAIHFQLFNADNNCEEFNFVDFLTQGDTNIYDISDLPGNADFTGSTGFVVISANAPSIIGMFRIIDDSGYEYRTNAADAQLFFGITESVIINDFPDYVLNFNDINGTSLSDVVGITYADNRDDGFSVYASPGLGTQFGVPLDNPLIFDEFEFPISCSPAVFACQAGGAFSFNKGIDNSLPNSHGYPRICPTGRLDGVNTAGWLRLPFYFHVCDDPFVCSAVPNDGVEFFLPTHFVGYLGLNNGNGTGSMDSWWGVSFFETGELDGEIILPGPSIPLAN